MILGYTWVTEFPLFELNEETGMIESTSSFHSPHRMMNIYYGSN